MANLLRKLFGYPPIVDRRLPHERWPEILHWQAGDTFTDMLHLGKATVMLVEIRADGLAVIDWFGDRQRTHVKYLVGHNQSLRNREISEELNGSNEYMDLLTEFNRAIAELQARDRKAD